MITMWKIDSVIEAIYDLSNAFYQAFFNPNEEMKKQLF